MKCNNIKRFVIMALIAALLGSIITGCSMEAGSGDAEKVLVIGYDQDSELMDTIKTAWYSDALIYIHDRLVTRDYEFGYKPVS